MTARLVVLASATLAGWLALSVAAASSASTPLVGVLAALVSLGCWHRAGQVASLAPVLGCIALLASGTSMLAAGVAGVLALVHVVGVDLAADAPGASTGTMLDALRALRPGAVLGAVGGAVVGVAAWLGAGAPADVVAPPLLAAPMLLLAAVLLVLGLRTRSGLWARLVSPRRLSRVTQRYLDRARQSG